MFIADHKFGSPRLNHASQENLLASDRLYHPGYLYLLSWLNGESALTSHSRPSQTCIYRAQLCLHDEVRTAHHLHFWGGASQYAAHRAGECYFPAHVVPRVVCDRFSRGVRRLRVQRQCKYTKSQNQWPQSNERPFHMFSSEFFLQAIEQTGIVQACADGKPNYNSAFRTLGEPKPKTTDP